MKSQTKMSHTKSICTRIAAGGVLGSLALASSADPGHGVAAGISAHQHVHLFEQVVVSPSWLIVVAGVVVVGLTALVMNRQIRAKAH